MENMMESVKNIMNQKPGSVSKSGSALNTVREEKEGSSLKV